MIALDDIFTNFCYVLGSGSLFPVDLDLANNQTVSELKEAIGKKMKAHTLSDYPLALWKVRPFC
jgi:hypothetical protein